MVEAEKPSTQKFSFPGFPDFEIQMHVRVWPHKIIDPREDDRFKEQVWASKFKMGNLGYKALVNPQECSEIIRYSDKISGLKAFW
jgi:hypothetical protein